MRRRALLGSLLAGVAGCTTRSEESSRPSASTDETTGQTPTTATTDSCSPVQTEFDLPPDV